MVTLASSHICLRMRWASSVRLSKVDLTVGPSRARFIRVHRMFTRCSKLSSSYSWVLRCRSQLSPTSTLPCSNHTTQQRLPQRKLGVDHLSLMSSRAPMFSINPYAFAAQHNPTVCVCICVCICAAEASTCSMLCMQHIRPTVHEQCLMEVMSGTNRFILVII